MLSQLSAYMYTNETVKKLKGMSQVKNATAKRVVLTYEYRLELYHIWETTPGIRAVKKQMKEDGFPVREMQDMIREMVTKFKKYGKPGIGKKSTGDRNHRVYGVVAMDILLATGKFEKAGRGIRFTTDFAEELWKAYPDQSIEDGLIAEGIDPITVGYARIHALKEKFEKRSTEQDNKKDSFENSKREAKENNESNKSQESSGNHSRYSGKRAQQKFNRVAPLYSKEEQKAYSRNPYVESCTKHKLTLSMAFFNAAKMFVDLGIDKILDIFDLDPKRMSDGGKTNIMRKVVTYRKTNEEADLKTKEDTRIEMRRICALEELMDIEIKKFQKQLAVATQLKKKEYFQFVEQMNKLNMEYGGTATKMLKDLDISRSTFYNVLRDPHYGKYEAVREEREKKDCELVRKVMDYKGYPKGVRMVYMQMERLTGHKMALNKIRRLMRKYNMHCGVRKANSSRRAAQERLAKHVKANLVRRRFRLARPGEIVLSDVTYLKTNDGNTYYGSASVDSASGRLLSFQCSDKNDTELVEQTVSEIARDTETHAGTIFHSDQGTVYLSDCVQESIQESGLQQSMSKRGNCWDNAPQESFFGHFKDEQDYAFVSSLEEMKTLLAEYKLYYNEERPQWGRNKMTPVEYEAYLNNMSEEEYAAYQKAEEARYQVMKEKAAKKARERAKSLGV